jgi:hypothetical protein
MEERTARLTILVDPRKKRLFEELCAADDQTPSQVVRRLIREYIEKRTGRPWAPPEADEKKQDEKKQDEKKPGKKSAPR